MTRRALPLLALIAAVLLIASEAKATNELRGFASAYAPGRMAEVVRYRLDNELWRTPPARGWYEAHGQIATNDCSQVGQMATLTDPAGREWRVLIADCAGHDGTAWMTDNRIIAELDWQLWTRLVDEHGRPLEVSIK